MTSANFDSERPTTSFANSLKWSLVSNWGSEGITAIVIFILAALVGPRDFGVVAMAGVYLAFIEMLLDGGFNIALIQRKNLERLHLDSMFWLICLASFVLMGLSIILSSWWAHVNRTPQLAKVISVLSLTIPIQGVTIVQVSLLQRRMDFKSLALRKNLSLLVGGVVGVTLAFRGWGIWALVAKQLTTSLASVIMLWSLSDWRPGPHFSPAHVRELLGFSLKSLAGKLGVFLQTQSDAMLIGLFFGPVATGLYRFADRLVAMTLSFATKAVHTVSLPYFSRQQSDKEMLRRSLVKCWRVSSVFTMPSLMVLAALSDSIMEATGKEWVEAAIVLKLLCIVGLAKSITLFTGSMLNAVARPGMHSILIWALAGSTTVAFVITGIALKESSLEEQILGMGLSRAVVFAGLFFPTNLIIIKRIVGISFKELVGQIQLPFLAGCVAFAAVTGLRSALVHVLLEPKIELALLGSLGLAGGVAPLLLLDESFRKRTKRLFRACIHPASDQENPTDGL